MELVAMIERGAFDEAAQDEIINTDWLSSPPDYVRRADFSQREQLTDLGDRAPRAPRSHAPESRQSRLLTIEQMLAAPPTRYVVADLIPERGLATIYGAPAAGKSFLALDLAFAIASGRSLWFGRRLVQASVAYVALEGKGGMQKRIKAYLAHTGDDVPGDFRFFTGNLSLLDRPDTQALAHEISRELGSGTVTFIDTLSRAAPGGDENSSIDMTTVIANAELLGEIVDGPLIFVHHTGKETGKGMRGHSSLLGAVDATVEVVNSNGLRSWTLKKNKDGEDGGLHQFELVSYPAGEDQYGNEMRSCAVRPLLGTVKPAPLAIVGKNRIAVMAAIRPLLAAAPAGIAWDQAISVAASSLAVPSSRRSSIAKDTLNGLIASGHLHLSTGKVSLP